MSDATPEGVDSAPLTIFDDFSGYVSASPEDYLQVFSSGMVVLDTNVLLDLYRQHPAAVEQLFRAMEALGDRIWFPHQVLAEFHRNRENAAAEPADDAEKAISKLNDQKSVALAEFRRWSQRVGLANERERAMWLQLERAYASLVEGISEVVEQHDPDMASDTSTDPVLERLARIVAGRRGRPMTPPAHAAAIIEAKRRVEKKIPPGYRDAAKAKDRNPNEEGVEGDYLLWEQLLVEASAREVDTMLVTRDTKPDWYWIRSGETRGPRNELAEEFHKRTGRRLYMLRTSSWIHHMTELLLSEDPSVGSTDVEAAVEVLDRSVDENSASPDGGWTTAAVRRLVGELREYYPVQFSAVHAAFSDSGYVSREAVYSMAGYDSSRSLRGFTRPIERITRMLVDEEILPYYVEPALVAVYDFASTGNNRAVGFSMPSAFRRAYAEAFDNRAKGE